MGQAPWEGDAMQRGASVLHRYGIVCFRWRRLSWRLINWRVAKRWQALAAASERAAHVAGLFYAIERRMLKRLQ